MTMFVGFPVTWLRLLTRVSVLCMLDFSLIGPYMLLPYTKRLNICSYLINLLNLKLQ